MDSREEVTSVDEFKDGSNIYADGFQGESNMSADDFQEGSNIC
jgi:hypothetical protein